MSESEAVKMPKVNPKRIAVFVVILVLIALAGWFSHQRWWGSRAWLYGYDEAHRGLEEGGYPWIGAEKPVITIHEYIDYECPHCPEAHKRMRKAMGSYLDEVRLVRHDYARMACVPNDKEKRRSSCAVARAAYCASKEGRYWEWNDHVMQNPRPLTGQERKIFIGDTAREMGFNVKAFDTCMFETETIDMVQGVFKDTRKKGIRQTPTYFVDGEMYLLVEVIDLIDERL